MNTFVRHSTVIGFVLLSALPTAAQDTTYTWNKSADFNLAVTQNSYSDSWVGGEAGSASWVSNLNALIEGPLAPRWISKSTAKLSFGQTHIQEEETKNWKKPVKSTDLIDLENTLRYLTGWFVNPFIGLRFESQLLDASVPSFKRYINPMRLTESAGFTRRLYQKDKEFIDSRIGFALRETFDRRVLDTVAQTTKTNTTTDGGLESVTDVSLKLHERIGWTSKLTVFKPLTVSDKSVPHWSATHVNWENILAASVTKYITVNLYVQWLYDKPIDLRGRFKETLALGFTYKLI
ncbi:MAG: DUF3078 domain-containing protein [candidate division Zixibacteria bacterium]|nr:DUF3078 domain-containing protein [candidate division Zixibacteria bacterium]